MKQIHINCDLGEGGEYDEQLMPLISACNIACGGHAGNLETMQHTVELALENGVEMGAHPSYPDKNNFGRKTVEISAEELKRSLVAQIMGIKQITEAAGGKLVHVKPHGALYNNAKKDEKTARIILDAIQEFDDPLMLYAPESSVIAKLAEGKLQVKYEAFADRNYNPDTSLVPRQKPNAVITEKQSVLEHLLTMFLDQKIVCSNSEKIDCHASTFCIHSDTENSVEILKYIRQKLEEKNIKILHSS